jgi:hypothetical protein
MTNNVLGHERRLKELNYCPRRQHCRDYSAPGFSSEFCRSISGAAKADHAAAQHAVTRHFAPGYDRDEINA